MIYKTKERRNLRNDTYCSATSTEENTNDDEKTLSEFSGNFYITKDEIIYRITYEINDNGEITNITITIVEIGKIIASDIVNEAENILGTTVEYKVEDETIQNTLDEEGITWEIFYVDSENIYLITSYYIPGELAQDSANYSPDYDGYNVELYYSGVMYDYSGVASWSEECIKWNNKYYNAYPSATQSNTRMTAYLCDPTVWQAFATNENAEYAFGSPTVEMWIAS